MNIWEILNSTKSLRKSRENICRWKFCFAIDQEINHQQTLSRENWFEAIKGAENFNLVTRAGLGERRFWFESFCVYARSIKCKKRLCSHYQPLRIKTCKMLIHVDKILINQHFQFKIWAIEILKLYKSETMSSLNVVNQKQLVGDGKWKFLIKNTSMLVKSCSRPKREWTNSDKTKSSNQKSF